MAAPFDHAGTAFDAAAGFDLGTTPPAVASVLDVQHDFWVFDTSELDLSQDLLVMD